MTALEAEALRSAVGVRDPDRNYNVIIDGHGTGFAPPSAEEWDRMTTEPVVLDESSLPQGVLMSAYDLSASSTFPIVGNQGGQGSCAAWAATYYSYGYQEATDNGWTDAKAGNPSHLMSAAWTYNKVNGGRDGGSWMGTNNYVTRDWGTASMRTMPYQDWDPIGWGGASAFREAPLHRSSAVNYIVSGPGAVNTVKQLIGQGVPVTFALDAGQFGAGLDGDYVISASEYNSNTLNHAQTVVGYDDAITDHGEVGAFRVVNSWGAGWGDGGYYWLTYAAFDKIGALLNLTYTLDIPNYVPTILAVWHFNAAPTRGPFSVGIGPRSSPLAWKTPSFAADGNHPFPTFMTLDISEFRSYYDAGTHDFYLALGSSNPTGTVSSFKIEFYEGGYAPGVATQASAQSPQVPGNTPAEVDNTFLYYAPIPVDQALDVPGLGFSSTSWVTWVPVDHHSVRGGSSMQTGDVGDSMSTDLRAMVEGPTKMWFDWRVSSEMSVDFLKFGIDGAVQASISGEVGWQTLSYVLGPGLHMLEWEYTKSAAMSVGQDTGWLDNLQFDNDPPLTTVSLSGNAGSNGWFRGPITATLTADDGNGIGVDATEYRVDGGNWTDYASPFGISGEGIHTIEYHSIDRGGNTEMVKQTPAMIDTVTPSTSVNISGTMGSSGWYTTPVMISLTPADATSGVDVTVFRLNGSAWQNYNGTFPIAAEGIHTLDYFSQDVAGNAEPTHSLEVKVDTSAPVTIESESGTLGQNNWYTSEVNVSLSSSDSVSDVGFTMYRVNQGPWKLYEGGIALLADGVHSVEFYSQDLSGNQEALQRADVKIDRTPPELVPGQAGGAIYANSSVIVSWSGSDATSGMDRFETSLDGASFLNHGPNASSLALSALSDGSHRITIRAVDVAGLLTERSLDFVVDTRPPVSSAAAVGTRGHHGWLVSEAHVTLTATDETTGVDAIRYRVDDGSWSVYDGAFDISQDGKHTVEYHAADVAGNQESVKTVTVLIDRVAPDLDILYPIGNLTVSDVNASWFAADYESGLDRCEVSIDGGEFVPMGSTMNVTEHLADGTHVLVVRAYDLAGNSAEKQFSFSVDTRTGGVNQGANAGLPWIACLAIAGLTVSLVTLFAFMAARRRERDGKPARRLPPPPALPPRP